MTGTIYDMEGAVLAADVQSTFNTALSMAKKSKRSVLVVDHGTGQAYQITPAGHRWRPPQWWEFRGTTLGENLKLYASK